MKSALKTTKKLSGLNASTCSQVSCTRVACYLPNKELNLADDFLGVTSLLHSSTVYLYEHIVILDDLMIAVSECEMGSRFAFVSRLKLAL